MLIGGDDISNDVITFGVCFHMFFNVCLHSRWFPFCADWRKSHHSVNGKLQANCMGNSNFQRHNCKLSFPLIPTVLPDHPRKLPLWLTPALSNISYKHKVCIICLFFVYYLVISLQKSSWKTFILKVRLCLALLLTCNDGH